MQLRSLVCHSCCCRSRSWHLSIRIRKLPTLSFRTRCPWLQMCIISCFIVASRKTDALQLSDRLSVHWFLLCRFNSIWTNVLFCVYRSEVTAVDCFDSQNRRNVVESHEWQSIRSPSLNLTVLSFFRSGHAPSGKLSQRGMSSIWWHLFHERFHSLIAVYRNVWYCKSSQNIFYILLIYNVLFWASYKLVCWTNHMHSSLSKKIDEINR